MKQRFDVKNVDARILQKFRLYCTALGLDFGVGVEEALEDWCAKNKKKVSKQMA